MADDRYRPADVAAALGIQPIGSEPEPLPEAAPATVHVHDGKGPAPAPGKAKKRKSKTFVVDDMELGVCAAENHDCYL